MILIVLVRAYQVVFSPLFPAACRHTPTCSNYAVTALRHHGPVFGTFLAIKRILRCHPFGTAGYDPVPDPNPSFERKTPATPAGEATNR
jgi:hypothetical protein